MKRVSATLALVFSAFATFSSAAQIQGFVSGYAPGDIDETKKANGIESSLTRHSDFMWSLGAEFLAFPAGPLMVGGGLGFFSVQTDGGDNVMMPSVPLFASVGVIGPEKWTARPYLEARVGYPIPATGYNTWWDKPMHFFVTGNVGVQLPYHMGVEFDCTYLTMNKRFSERDETYRVSSLKLGGSITVHFDLFKKSDGSNESPVANFVAEPAAEEFSYGYSEPSSGYDESVEQPAEDPVTEGSVAEPVSEEQPAEGLPEETPAEETAEPAAEPVAEEVPAEEASVEPEESPAEETVAEAPAPAPEKKPAAKKKAASKKKTSKKSTAKKSSKKSKAKSKKKK